MLLLLSLLLQLLLLPLLLLLLLLLLPLLRLLLLLLLLPLLLLLILLLLLVLILLLLLLPTTTLLSLLFFIHEGLCQSPRRTRGAFEEVFCTFEEGFQGGFMHVCLAVCSRSVVLLVVIIVRDHRPEWERVTVLLELTNL